MRILSDVLSLLLPDRCACCLGEGGPVCTSCAGALTRIQPPGCERCGAPTAVAVRRCRDCAGRRIAFASARSAVAYDGPAVPLVRTWKDGGRRSLDAVVGAIVVDAVGRPDVDAVTSVPPVRDRLLWRGHNPSDALAEELASRWRLAPPAELLVRRRETRPQRGLTSADRRRNVAQAFAAPAAVPRRVLLVDDVYTTGATVSAAASALRRAGARAVHVVTFARALRAAGDPRRLR